MGFGVVGLVVCLVSVAYATGAFNLADSESVPGAGDVVPSDTRAGKFVYVSEFKEGEAGKVRTYQWQEDGSLALVGDTPAGREPRAIAMARNGDYAVIVNSIDDQLTTMRPGPDGVLIPVETFPSGGDNPFDVAVAFNDVVLVTNRDSGDLTSMRIDRRGRLYPADNEPAGVFPHVVSVSSRGLVTSSGAGALESSAAGEDKVVLVAVANQTGQSVSLYRMNREGALTSLGDIPLGRVPRTLSWLGTRLFVALDEPGPPLPGTPEDFIRSFEIGFDGTVRQGPDTPAGYFLTDIEATKKGLFAVTVNLNGADPDRDEVRVYKIDDLSLTLDAAIQPNSAFPSFKQIATEKAEKPVDTHVFITEFQGGVLRSLIYDRKP
jgi:6-phosphogluconolactonase (cycloisomerase 2 family)